MRKVPTIDIRDCTDCGSCLEICPRVFVRNSETGYIEVLDLPEYSEEDIQEAIGMCPADCITWDEI
jgi:ferredoxin